jgi:LacI family transcriptional regulator
MNVNIKWLAKELNLSIATVSRALQDSYMVSKETKQRVLDLAKKSNYHANPYASSLRRQNSKTIAVVIPEIANNFFSLAINGIDEVAQKNNYHMLIYLTHDSMEREVSITRHLQNGRVDGVLISVSSETDTYDHLIEVKEKHIPLVFFDRVCNEIDTVKITTDDYQSGFNATEHLIQNGCTRVAYLQVSKHLSIGQKRLKGYYDALNKYNIRLDEKLVVVGSNDPTENHKYIKKLLSSKKRPDGVFASVESLAITVYDVCHELGLSIPDDVKVISFSNLATAPLLAPSLTTITQPAYNIGKESAISLFQILKNNKGLIRKNMVIPSSLMARDSTRMDYKKPSSK